jgi:hypothetical protein
MEGALRIVNMVGSVVVHGWNKDTVLVRGTLNPADRFFAGGGYTGVKMFVESENDRDPKPARLEVWVPSRVRLWIKTATANIDVSDVTGGLDLYVVSGTITVNGNPHELNAEAYPALGLRRDLQLALSLDREDVWAVDGRRTAPDLHGTSGGGVWRLPVREDRSVADVKLTAVITEHHQKAKVKHLVGTRITAILSVLAEQDLDLRYELVKIGVRVA